MHAWEGEEVLMENFTSSFSGLLGVLHTMSSDMHKVDNKRDG